MLKLGEQCIILEMKSKSKNEALEELSTTVHSQCTVVDPTVLLDVLREREQVGSTGVGNGVAIPHAKVPGLDQLLLCFGRSVKGISFDAIDNRPVHLFVQILSPMGMADEYLRTLARISRLFKIESNRKFLLQARTKQEILDFFNAPEI
ncbi:MAG TPA: PTS sugar transporter subunit IIA [Desulfobulbaceae bacterium]|nr:PTS sugar transporter subunit IIA [Desulfobulbaceae bacterium]